MYRYALFKLEIRVVEYAQQEILYTWKNSQKR